MHGSLLRSLVEVGLEVRVFVVHLALELIPVRGGDVPDGADVRRKRAALDAQVRVFSKSAWAAATLSRISAWAAAACCAALCCACWFSWAAAFSFCCSAAPGLSHPAL
jgi:hypothetical protein